jgi:fructokinase
LINGYPDGFATGKRRCSPDWPTRGRKLLELFMIVVSGEALMDVFAAGETPTGLMLDARIGGSPLNVAIGLRRMAQPAAFFGAVSSGFLGDRLIKALHDEAVDTRCTVRVQAPATLGLVGLDAKGVPSYAFYGEGEADRKLPLNTLHRVPAAMAYHFGSYAMVVEPVAATQRALVEREHQRAVIAYDPNIRLNVEPTLARWQDTLAWMLPRTHILKVSDEDLELLFPGADTAALALSWLQQGVRLVVVTRGGQGARAWTTQHQLEARAVPVQVVDTVGAGDTFQAALLTGLAERSLLTPTALATLSSGDLQAVLDFATKAAAITCSRRGADLPRRTELPACS